MKHAIAAIILAISASVSHAQSSAKDNHQGCLAIAQSVNFMLKMLEDGFSPTEVVETYKKFALKHGHTGAYNSADTVLSLALLSAGDGKQSGNAHISEVYRTCMMPK